MQRTSGNPLYVKELVEWLEHEALLKYNSESNDWMFQLDATSTSDGENTSSDTRRCYEQQNTTSVSTCSKRLKSRIAVGLFVDFMAAFLAEHIVLVTSNAWTADHGK
jgi:predicted ATPase